MFYFLESYLRILFDGSKDDINIYYANCVH